MRTAEWLFTENETNSLRLWGTPNASPYVKDAFHARVIEGRAGGGEPCAAGHQVRRAGSSSPFPPVRRRPFASG